uniref:Uncharacterized protein n=1 Tax=Siphoviridae sp. ctlzn3 TaxID=2826450 RepID=A0A8S5N5T3_9CAUD|nr:MAG TPA: hypothetical protein [Siphoviridae sp. ctlzn3]
MSDWHGQFPTSFFISRTIVCLSISFIFNFLLFVMYNHLGYIYERR